MPALTLPQFAAACLDPHQVARRIPPDPLDTIPGPAGICCPPVGRGCGHPGAVL
ncbi:hypothetical protein [Dactylosporangium matsuzakiense]|uniref:hypothetical protein n=1 Tax=Dactylosporangium matsuzakiense TaxID=53360 RepID=UPI0022F334BA|nr:hypothetical protein [Dactylosporangium matsuzakiense]